MRYQKKHSFKVLYSDQQVFKTFSQVNHGGIVHLYIEHHMDILEVINMAQYIDHFEKDKNVSAHGNIDAIDKVDINIEEKADKC